MKSCKIKKNKKISKKGKTERRLKKQITNLIYKDIASKCLKWEVIGKEKLGRMEINGMA